ncbi:hypothetical protein SOCE26_050310 [Sorangium cellulosum]|uniref:Tat pathway signal sequence n=1 Tax=Sorangium cellulosum TaxID=56 RepID=A0A2L0EWA3_SORCE|nr:hypothetical protein SOCE26_050310 [Sorangium cellulosum]
MTKNLTRRIFLRGLGGAAVAAPFLSSVAEREAEAQPAGGGAPKRLIVLFTHYGCLTNRWFPAKSHGALTAADYEATTLKHLAPYASKLLMPRGIRAMNEWSFGRTHGQNNDPHTQVMGSYFTCYPVTPESDKFGAKSTGRSLDHVCAEQVNPNGVDPLLMQIGGVRTDSMSNFSYRKPGEIFSGIGSPTTIFNNLTNLFGQGSMSPDTYKVVRGKSVIDIVRDDLSTLQRYDMSQADKQKLADWMDLLHQTTGTVRAQCSEETAAALGLTSQTVQAASQGGGLGVDLSKSTNIMMDLAVLTAICDQNRVIFMKFPGTMIFKWDGVNHEKDTHGISHRIGTAFMGGDCLAGVNDMIAQIDDWYAKKFAYLVGRLDSFDEGDGKLLDNTATVWFQEDSDGNSHNLNNLPIIQAGSCGGYFKVGQAVNVFDGKADLTRGNSEGACGPGDGDVSNADLDGTGTPADIANAPINKYFCNLMNAIGVKAGADGFPAKGGTAEVTHFGKYDDTKLFANESNAASIKNPGEFKELRASG